MCVCWGAGFRRLSPTQASPASGPRTAPVPPRFPEVRRSPGPLAGTLPLPLPSPRFPQVDPLPTPAARASRGEGKGETKDQSSPRLRLWAQRCQGAAAAQGEPVHLKSWSRAEPGRRGAESAKTDLVRGPRTNRLPTRLPQVRFNLGGVAVGGVKGQGSEVPPSAHQALGQLSDADGRGLAGSSCSAGSWAPSPAGLEARMPGPESHAGP